MEGITHWPRFPPPGGSDARVLQLGIHHASTKLTYPRFGAYKKNLMFQSFKTQGH